MKNKISIIFIIIFFNSSILFADIQFPTFIVKSIVNSIFPFEKEYTGGILKISDPNFSIEDNRIIIYPSYDNKFIGFKKSGRFKISTSLKFDDKTSSLYFSDMRLDSFETETNKFEPQTNIISKIITGSLFKLFANKPIDISKHEVLFDIIDIQIIDNKIMLITK